MKYRLVGLVLALAGCDLGESAEAPDVPPAQSELSLRGVVPDDALLVGVTEAPSGRRYVLDRDSGLYELGSSSPLVWNTTGLTGIELTDVVALDDERFAVTATNDGFLFDARNHGLSSYFCYLPALPSEPQGQTVSVSQMLQQQGIAVEQRTDSVAFNPDTQRLFAQPRTFRLDTGAVAGSELFVFSSSGGQPIQVVPLGPDFVTGGMAATITGRLLLGSHNLIYEVELSGAISVFRELDSAFEITGMSATPKGELLILDGPGQRLLTLRGAL
jgi:hypothetical protein